MALITTVTDWWLKITNGKCRCGKKLKRNYYHCSAKCMNDELDEMDKNMFNDDY